MSSSLNIILFGGIGVGKSSVVNLIAGREIAGTSLDVVACTTSFRAYPVDINGRTFHVWDTVGLEKPETDAKGYLSAIDQARELVRHLGNHGGVDLLLFCVRANEINKAAVNNYRLICEVLCRSEVPIALVVTHLEREPNMEDWWVKNQEQLRKYGFKVAGHACVAGLLKHARYQESRTNIIKLLEAHNGIGRLTVPSEGRLIGFLRLLGLFAPLKKSSKRKDIVKALTKRCGLDQKIAEDVANKLQGE